MPSEYCQITIAEDEQNHSVRLLSRGPNCTQEHLVSLLPAPQSRALIIKGYPWDLNFPEAPGITLVQRVQRILGTGRHAGSFSEVRKRVPNWNLDHAFKAIARDTTIDSIVSIGDGYTTSASLAPGAARNTPLWYNPEDDLHYATSKVKETLKFALKTRTSGKASRNEGESRKDYVKEFLRVVSKLFWIEYTMNTKVGDEMIRGVSGGEKKRVSIAEAMIIKARTQSCFLDHNGRKTMIEDPRLGPDLVTMDPVAGLEKSIDLYLSTGVRLLIYSVLWLADFDTDSRFDMHSFEDLCRCLREHKDNPADEEAIIGLQFSTVDLIQSMGKAADGCVDVRYAAGYATGCPAGSPRGSTLPEKVRWKARDPEAAVEIAKVLPLFEYEDTGDLMADAAAVGDEIEDFCADLGLSVTLPLAG